MRASKVRAAGALAFPFFMISFALIVGSEKGVVATDYFEMIRRGEIGLYRQLAGWIAMAYWIARFFPSAIDAISSDGCLINLTGKDVILNSGHIIPTSEIESIKVKSAVFDRYLLIVDSSGNSYRQSVQFCKDDPLTVASRCVSASPKSHASGAQDGADLGERRGGL